MKKERKRRSKESNLSAIRPLEAKYAHIDYINMIPLISVKHWEARILIF